MIATEISDMLTRRLRFQNQKPVCGLAVTYGPMQEFKQGLGQTTRVHGPQKAMELEAHVRVFAK